jgi:hypothetical protein
VKGIPVSLMCIPVIHTQVFYKKYNHYKYTLYNIHYICPVSDVVYISCQYQTRTYRLHVSERACMERHSITSRALIYGHRIVDICLPNIHLFLLVSISLDQILYESPVGVKWELGFSYFWLGKWDFMHWDWDSSAKKQ